MPERRRGHRARLLARTRRQQRRLKVALEGLEKLAAIARGDWSDPGRAPDGDPPGACDWGYCDDPATHWRWAEELGGWLPVCAEHVGPAAPAAAIDADLDERYEDHAR